MGEEDRDQVFLVSSGTRAWDYRMKLAAAMLWENKSTWFSTQADLWKSLGDCGWIQEKTGQVCGRKFNSVTKVTNSMIL